ncbi:MAG: M23 family metallopeptidase, partial [Planctomycetota bacterium]|nr:M23 family metallopeptidase [Planctomycetota bacterium]
RGACMNLARMLLLAMALLAAAGGAWAAAIPWTTGPGETPKTPGKPDEPPPPVPGYDDRQNSCPQNQPCKEDSLVLPLARAAGVYPPQKTAAGQLPLGDVAGMRTDIVWQVVPWQKEHEEFLARLAAVKQDEQRFALADWCSEKGLAACREWLLRDILRTHWFSLDDPAYQKALALWLPGAARRSSPYVFDLPVRGEWFVMPDERGTNRRKHGTTFARNLIVVRGGRETDGKGTDLKNYYAWDQPFYAVADGRITKVDDRHPDPPAGHGVGVEEGNYITQDCGGGIYAFYGHIKSGSAEVKEGQLVRRGTALGRVGNSGGNGKPHLHFILMDADHFSIPGRYRFEQLDGKRWTPRDGADMAEDTAIRPAAEKASPPSVPTKGPAGKATPRGGR